MTASAEKTGVLYVLHGGMDSSKPQYMWDAAVQMFSYDPNHPVYGMVIWNPDAWSMVLQTEFAVKFIRKYEFEYERIGGTDPFHRYSDAQAAAMKRALEAGSAASFEVDCACWMRGDRPEYYPYPRFLYNGPPEAQAPCTYCGQDEPEGPWEGCNPERYNVDGPVERLLKKGVDRILAVDMTVGGARFFKTYDVVQMSLRALADWNRTRGTNVTLSWVNDPTDLMQRAYPAAPAGWTPMLGEPEQAPAVSLEESPNPVVSDPGLAELHVDGIEKRFSPDADDSLTGVVLFNHGIFDPMRRYFDPKIDDTLVLNRAIKALLLERHPDMQPGCIVGAYGGVRQRNPENGLVERTREMRGEDLAHAYLFRSASDMPSGEWGFRYWDALDFLKSRGVRHIVVGFPQVVSDSVLTMVEVYNQIAKEIGVKTWMRHAGGDFESYPAAGHPFADYWGNWVDCDSRLEPGTRVCLTMGEEGYPPQRQTPPDAKREDMDPSLAFDLSDYGHLGYDPARGRPDAGCPVQQQYRGTWDVYVPPNDDPRLGELLARHVLAALEHRR